MEESIITKIKEKIIDHLDPRIKKIRANKNIAMLIELLCDLNINDRYLLEESSFYTYTYDCIYLDDLDKEVYREIYAMSDIKYLYLRVFMENYGKIF